MQAATATLEDMRSLSTAPLTLLAELILVGDLSCGMLCRSYLSALI